MILSTDNFKCLDIFGYLDLEDSSRETLILSSFPAPGSLSPRLLDDDHH